MTETIKPIRMEVRRTETAPHFWLIAVFPDGSETPWGHHTTERGVRRMLSIYSKRVGLTKKSADLATAEK